VIGRDDLAADGTFHDVADALEYLPVVATFFREQRRVGRHAIEDANRGQRLDVLHTAGIYEQFHNDLPPTTNHQLQTITALSLRRGSTRRSRSAVEGVNRARRRRTRIFSRR